MRNIWLLSPLILSKQVEIVFIFQFLNDKIHNYLKLNITVNLIVQKLICKQIPQFPQKVYKLSKAKFSRFDRTRGDNNQIFRTYEKLNEIEKEPHSSLYIHSVSVLVVDKKIVRAS